MRGSLAFSGANSRSSGTSSCSSSRSDATGAASGAVAGRVVTLSSTILLFGVGWTRGSKSSLPDATDVVTETCTASTGSAAAGCVATRSTTTEGDGAFLACKTLGSESSLSDTAVTETAAASPGCVATRPTITEEGLGVSLTAVICRAASFSANVFRGTGCPSTLSAAIGTAAPASAPVGLEERW